MRLLSTGKYDGNIKLKWNECLFVDRYDEYYLYTECGNTTFSYRLKKYLEARQWGGKLFTENSIRLIEMGKRS